VRSNDDEHTAHLRDEPGPGGVRKLGVGMYPSWSPDATKIAFDKGVKVDVQIREKLRRVGLEDPNSYGDLWAWYGHWSQHLPNWASRRVDIRELYQPLLDA
jgi:hypothetical protein